MEDFPRWEFISGLLYKYMPEELGVKPRYITAGFRCPHANPYNLFAAYLILVQVKFVVWV